MTNTIEIVGQDYPRVTEIISATEEPEKRKKLLRWMKKIEKIHGVKGAEVYRQSILDNGTNLHQSIEDYLSNKIQDVDHSALNLVLPLLKVIKSQNENLIIEKRLYCHKYKFKGQPDLICQFEDLPTIIDWTTSLQIKQKKWVEHKFIQAGAYAIASELELGITIKQLAVVVVCESAKRCQVFTDSPDQWQSEFLKRLEQYQQIINKNNDAIKH
jgi:hypothetical protein